MVLLAHHWKTQLTSYYAALIEFWKRQPLLLFGLLLLILAPDHTFSEPEPLTLWRTQAQNFLHTHLLASIPQQAAAKFLSGLFMGHIHEPFLKAALGELGLQHILAISGFHFSLIAWFLALLFARILPRRSAGLCTALLLTLYLLFVGIQPSVVRAWTSALITLLLLRPSSGLNRLGAGLVLCLLIDPSFALSWGFQLSFLATAGILLFYGPIDKLLQHLFPWHYLEEALEYPLLHQGVVVFACIFRKALALTLAVHCLLTPLLLHLFGTLSLTGLLYNLFFPLFAAASLILLILSLALDLIGLGGPLHILNGAYTEAILKTATGLPQQLKWAIHATLSSEIAWTLIIFSICVGIWLQLRPLRQVL